jgi:hypothetical protein
MADMNQGELELELEDEFHEGEGKLEDEKEFGVIGNIVGRLPAQAFQTPVLAGSPLDHAL